MTVGELFAGIGGMGLGLEWAGMSVEWAVEMESYPAAVYRLRFPETDLLEQDAREVDFASLAQVDVISAGFPCQDISYAGRGAGIEGERSGLWSEVRRATGILRPRIVLIENSPALLRRGLDVVLGDLVSLGYAAEWECVPAQAVGAPHRRDRIFIVASLEDPAGVFGPISGEQFATFDRDGPRWDTFQTCLFEGVTEFDDGWPRSGYVSGRTAYSREPLVPLWSVRGESEWATPAAADSQGSHGGGQGRSLRTDIYEWRKTLEKWPTPTASDAWSSDFDREGIEGMHNLSLGSAVRKSEAGPRFFPTPTAHEPGFDPFSRNPVDRDGNPPAHPNQRWYDPVTGRLMQKGLSQVARLWPTPKSSPSGPDFAREGREESGGDDLATAVAREQFRSPSARDWKGQSAKSWREREQGDTTPTLPDQVRGQLNPPFVEWLMGVPLGWTDLESEPFGHAMNASGVSDAGGPLETLLAAYRSNRDSGRPGWWSSEPDVGRIAEKVPARADRLKALGNAVVAQVAEFIGTRILATHGG